MCHPDRKNLGTLHLNDRLNLSQQQYCLISDHHPNISCIGIQHYSSIFLRCSQLPHLLWNQLWHKTHIIELSLNTLCKQYKDVFLNPQPDTCLSPCHTLAHPDLHALKNVGRAWGDRGQLWSIAVFLDPCDNTATILWVRRYPILIANNRLLSRFMPRLKTRSHPAFTALIAFLPGSVRSCCMQMMLSMPLATPELRSLGLNYASITSLDWLNHALILFGRWSMKNHIKIFMLFLESAIQHTIFCLPWYSK